mgnify:CR=1 FL=1
MFLSYSASPIYSYATEVGTVQGEVRSGNAYAYWVEVTPDAYGNFTTGKFNVLLPEDINSLQRYLERQAPFR